MKGANVSIATTESFRMQKWPPRTVAERPV